MDNDGHEEESVHGTTDHRFAEAGRNGLGGQGGLPTKWVHRAHTLQVAGISQIPLLHLQLGTKNHPPLMQDQ